MAEKEFRGSASRYSYKTKRWALALIELYVILAASAILIWGSVEILLIIIGGLLFCASITWAGTVLLD